MARVVQRRNAPPYLLIVFVFLFLISAVLAVLGFMSGGDEKKQNVRLKSDVKELRDENTVLKNDVKELVEQITGKSSIPAGSAISMADKVFENPVIEDLIGAEQSGLAAEMLTLATIISEQKKTIADLNAALVEKDKALDVKDKAAAGRQKTHEEELQERNAKIQELTKALAEEKALRDESIQDVQDNLDQRREELQKDLIAKEKLLEKSELEKAAKDDKINRLKDDIDKLRGDKKSDDIVNKADGQIEKITRTDGVCYVNIGKKDRVQTGMTLSVYSSKGVKQENIKGKLLVTNVHENFSECKITEEDKNAPIVVGDDVANIAFHPVRKNVFVVQGLFDLHGTGNPNEFGAGQVRDVIRKAGGIVADTVNYQTDYVVMGSEPIKPTRLEEDAPAAAQQAYQKQLQRYDEYRSIREAAQTLRIPILNTNRFILLTGYEPEPGPQ
jgi:hypothetical protein